MSFNCSAEYVVGVDLGGTNVRAAVLDRRGQRLGGGRMPSLALEGMHRTVQQIHEAVEQAIAAAGVDKGNIAGLGIGVPGHINPEGTHVLWAPNFYDDGHQYRNMPLAQAVSATTGLAVLMGNDANVAALGEFRFGAGKAVQNMVMVTLGTGIGGGIILNGKLWTGSSGGAGEIGHIIIAAADRGGAAAFGSLESMGQISAIIERCARKISLGRKTILAEQDWHFLTPKMISDAALLGDAVAVETFEETGYYIGLGLASIINLLNPEMITIGGGVAGAGELILDPIRRSTLANGIRTMVDVCQIVPAELGDDAGIFGGASLILDAINA